jgi:hypothetical protein
MLKTALPIYANAQAHNIELKASAYAQHWTGTGQQNGGANVGTGKATPGSLLGQPTQPGQFTDVQNLVMSIESRSYRRTPDSPYLCESTVLVGGICEP